MTTVEREVRAVALKQAARAAEKWRPPPTPDDRPLILAEVRDAIAAAIRSLK